ncbi:MAG: murein tripeptide amidase MpaA [Urechidicola sp.]|jgi:murein tripeptide amidase MpaA|tara:strand:- start:538 stop:1773 length:1236 start_codon:yes stop_codon:yes gene_type:complete
MLKKNQQFLLFIFLSVIVLSCGTRKLKTHDFPNVKHTFNKPISYQDKKIYVIDTSFFADNMFDAARLNAFEKVNDSTLQVTILPENEPINESPHYAFRIWSSIEKDINLKLNYPTSSHRYWPKISSDGKNWIPIDSANFKLVDSNKNAILQLQLTNKKIWISAQEIHNSSDAKNWSKSVANHQNVRYSVIGKSKLNRDLIGLDVYEGDPKGKEMIVILSRQHPPEVTGYLAMQAFVKELLGESRLAKDFRSKYRTLIFPMLNPDGVDLGHWRHNSGGIDLNRDWAYYRQDEVKTIVNYIVDTSNKDRNKVVLGLDFHSTQEDLYYTFPDDVHSSIYPFKDYWLGAIDAAIPAYTPDDRPYAVGDPISKGWFYLQFNAESVTYEIGDETPRAFIKLKAQIAAREMMKLLILK